MRFKKTVAAILSVVLIFSNSCIVFASDNDVEAELYGFEVDNSKFYDTIWYTDIKTNVYCSSTLIGVCTTNIGVTGSRKKVSGNKNLDQIMIKCTMKGRGADCIYGYSEHLTIESKLPSGTQLVSYSPVAEAEMASYDVGCSASTDKTAGISASTKVTKKALEINCYSDTAARLVKECSDNNICRIEILLKKINQRNHNMSH